MHRLLLVLTGHPGVGKSTLSRTVCDVIGERTGAGAVPVSTDDVIPIQCADALHCPDLAAQLPYRAEGNGFHFDQQERERLSMRAVAGLVQLLALLRGLADAHLVAELPSRWAPLFLRAAVTAGLTDGCTLVGIELEASPATCRQRNRQRARQLPSDAVQQMTQPSVDVTWRAVGAEVFAARARVSTEGSLDDVRRELAGRVTGLLDAAIGGTT